MQFVTGRGFAELQIRSVRDPHRTVCKDFVPEQFAKILSPDSLRKTSITLKLLEYFDKILKTY